MSHEPVQVDPYQQLNSDSPEKIKAGLIVLRERAALGDQKASKLLEGLKEAKCPDEPAEAARWVLQTRRNVSEIKIHNSEYSGDSGCVLVLVLVTCLTSGLWLLG
jgi:hypothetical protein